MPLQHGLKNTACIRHNAVRDHTASLLREVTVNVGVEPTLQPLEGERLRYRTANTEDGARLDVVASGIWGSQFERTFLDIRVFNPHVRSNKATSLSSTYRRHEQEKRRAYEERVREVEHASFLPLVFSASGGCGRAADVFYKRLGKLVSEKRKDSFSTTMAWIRCVLSFSLVRSCNISLRGHRSRRSESINAVEMASPASLAVSDCRIR